MVNQQQQKIVSKFPNGQIIKSTMEGDLDIPMLPDIARKAHIKHLLVSIGDSCDTGFTVTSEIKDDIDIHKEKKSY